MMVKVKITNGKNWSEKFGLSYSLNSIWRAFSFLVQSNQYCKNKYSRHIMQLVKEKLSSFAACTTLTFSQGINYTAFLQVLAEFLFLRIWCLISHFLFIWSMMRRAEDEKREVGCEWGVYKEEYCEKAHGFYLSVSCPVDPYPSSPLACLKHFLFHFVVIIIWVRPAPSRLLSFAALQKMLYPTLSTPSSSLRKRREKEEIESPSLHLVSPLKNVRSAVKDEDGCCSQKR